jgi:hypothetical protein
MVLLGRPTSPCFLPHLHRAHAVDCCIATYSMQVYRALCRSIDEVCVLTSINSATWKLIGDIREKDSAEHISFPVPLECLTGGDCPKLFTGLAGTTYNTISAEKPTLVGLGQHVPILWACTRAPEQVLTVLSVARGTRGNFGIHLRAALPRDHVLRLQQRS